eukprot:2692867-Prymnesium_polylepis.1
MLSAASGAVKLGDANCVGHHLAIKPCPPWRGLDATACNAVELRDHTACAVRLRPRPRTRSGGPKDLMRRALRAAPVASRRRPVIEHAVDVIDLRVDGLRVACRVAMPMHYPPRPE